MNPEEKAVRRRAFVYSFLTNLPGASVVTACVQKGDAVSLTAGDRIIVDLTFQDSAAAGRGHLAVTGSVIK